MDVAELEGNGTASGITQYEFKDKNPMSGINYYRLKQVDYDGTINWSSLAQANYQIPLSIFPNPASQLVHLRFSSEA